MHIRVGEDVVVVPPATDLHWRQVVAVLADPILWARRVWPATVRLPYPRIRSLHDAWIRHNGLVNGDQAKRLAYMMQKYSDGIEYDLRRHLDVSMTDLWRNRRWRELLNYIDLLPSDSHKNRLLSTDEEHMEAIIKASRDARAEPGRPSMSDWGQLESMIAVLIDAVNRNTEVTHAVGAGKKAKPMKIPNYPRPATAAEKVERKLQKAEHEQMVAMLLPSKREGQVS